VKTCFDMFKGGKHTEIVQLLADAGARSRKSEPNNNENNLIFYYRVIVITKKIISFPFSFFSFLYKNF